MAIREATACTDITHYIAIDFGTYGCGIAHRCKDYGDGSEIHVFSNWAQGKTEVKCPTILLLDGDKNVQDFGYSAYLSWVKSKKDGYLFKRFKMNLYDEKHLTRETKIRATNGSELPAILVLSKCLGYLRHLIMKELNDLFPHPARKIQWILTIPAIWSPSAKLFMKEAALQAGIGIEENSLRLVLEPEAAAAYCRETLLNIDEHVGVETSRCYLLVDCGGGTLDIVAHKMVKKRDGSICINELHKAHGGPFGGFTVNDEFERMLIDMCHLNGSEALHDIQCQPSWTKLITEFETAKLCTTDKEQCKACISIPPGFCRKVEGISNKDFEELVNQYRIYKLECDNSDEMFVPYSSMCRFFFTVISKIVVAIEQVLQKPQCATVAEILLVGGFAESPLLYNAVKEKFSDHYMVARSTNPCLAVLKGAIIYAMDPRVIESRVSTHALGIESLQSFVPGIHRPDKKITIEGKDFCQENLSVIIEVDQHVSAKKVFTHVCTPASTAKDSCEVRIYGSHKKNPMYVSDDGCYLIGSVTVKNLPPCSSRNSRDIEVTFSMTGAEIVVSAHVKNTHQMLPAQLNLVRSVGGEYKCTVVSKN